MAPALAADLSAAAPQSPTNVQLEAPSAPAKMQQPAAAPALVLKNVRVRIQKRPAAAALQDAQAAGPTFENLTLQELRLPEVPTLDHIREALTGCELGDPGRDIFFPAWTKSLYIAWAGQRGGDLTVEAGDADASAADQTAALDKVQEQASAEPASEMEGVSESSALGEHVEADETVETVETDEQLREALERELAAPGSLTLLLQECRNARYSRRKQPSAPRHGHSLGRHVVAAQLQQARAFMFAAAAAAAHSHMYAAASLPPPRADRPVYYDRPLATPYSYAAPFPCVPPGSYEYALAAAGYPLAAAAQQFVPIATPYMYGAPTSPQAPSVAHHSPAAASPSAPQ